MTVHAAFERFLAVSAADSAALLLLPASYAAIDFLRRSLASFFCGPFYYKSLTHKKTSNSITYVPMQNFKLGPLKIVTYRFYLV